MAFNIVVHVDVLLMKKGKYLLAGEIFYSNPEYLLVSFRAWVCYGNVEGFKSLELGTVIL